MTKQTRRTALTLALFAGGVVSGFAARALGPLPPWASLAWILLVMAFVGWIAIYCWRMLDEAQKEAHKWAWYWGGSLGLLVGFMGLTMAVREPSLLALVTEGASPRKLIELGFAAAAGSTVIGYGVAWAAWWLTRR